MPIPRIKDLLNRLPDTVYGQIQNYREAYTRTANDYTREAMRTNEEIRVRMGGYVLGLMHAGLITEFERRLLFCYMTIAERKIAKGA